MGGPSNKELLIEKITDNLTRLSVINLDFYESLNDRLMLKEIFKSFFKEGDRLFFSFRREENLTDDDELLALRKKIPLMFEQQGDYIFLRRVDEEKFDTIGHINYTDHTPSFLLDVWKYFYAFTVFMPFEHVTWSDYVHYVKTKGINDIDGKKLLNDGLTNFILIKGLGGDYLNISYVSDIKLPDIASLIDKYKA